MFDFKGASIRKGVVVNATDDAGSLVRLSVAEARKIGQQINAARADFSSAHIDTIERVAAEYEGACFIAGVKVDDDLQSPLEARFQPGLILDFPRLLINEERFGTLALRACITVCALDARSKIWTRCVTDKSVGTLSPESLDLFHDFAAQLCDAVNAATKVLYQKHFKLERFQSAPQLNTHGNISLMLADCAGEEFQSALLQRFEEVSWSDTRLEKIDDLLVSEALRGVTGLAGAPTEATDAHPETSAFELRDGASFYPFVANSGAQSLFVAYADDDTAHLYGIVGGASNSPDTKNYPASVGLSAELANHLGSVY